MQIDDDTEWLEADGLGGFASGTTSGIRTRRYHALLLTAMTPPTGRVVLVNSFDASVDTTAGSYALSTQRYAPGVLHPDGVSRIVGFTREPWPTWEFQVGDGTHIRQEIFVRHGTAGTVIRWEVMRAEGPLTLRMRPFLCGRDYHAMHHENNAFRVDPEIAVGSTVAFHPYDGIPRIELHTNGEYRHSPDWYRNFLYDRERERGLDDIEDLASPGECRWDLSGAGSVAVCVLTSDGPAPLDSPHSAALASTVDAMRAVERARRASFPSALDRAADAYLVRRGGGRTIVAGYPWFTDWGRDTFIALRGLCLATGRLQDARAILLAWSGAISDGMLPNRFPDRGEAPEFNSVDASLWYVVAVGEFLRQAAPFAGLLSGVDERTLRDAARQIIDGYAAGTRFGIALDGDGLLRAGVPGMQLTWMDARVGDRVITPRIGKPVEIQALWLNALAFGADDHPGWREVFERGRAAFIERFWSDERGHLADVVDVDHQPGTRDDTFRPNQIFAVGGLPVALVSGDRARRIVEAVERRLLTPMGLRSLARDEPGYIGRYAGGADSRDASYHQGIVWPWLMGPFVEAWVRVAGNTPSARQEARRRFLEPMLAHLDVAGLGHVSEIADAEPPFTPRGCPFQAWSLGEVIRLDRVVLAASSRDGSPSGDAPAVTE